MLLQILFNLAIAAIAEAILMRIPVEKVPSFHRVAPTYLKLVTSSKLWSFMLMFQLILCMLLAMILLFSLYFVSYALPLSKSTSLLVRS